MQELRSDIKGYDEYVKDFEAVCNKDYVRPKSETEIWEEMSEGMSECDEFKTGERIGVTVSLLGEGRSIDKKSTPLYFRLCIRKFRLGTN